MCEPAEPTHAAIGLGSSAELQAPQTLTDEETNPELVAHSPLVAPGQPKPTFMRSLNLCVILANGSAVREVMPVW